MYLQLPMYYDRFIKDFAFPDVKFDLNQADEIFTATEMKRISDIDDPEQQVIQMFFFLCEKDEKHVWKFVDILHNCYDWLLGDLVPFSFSQLSPEEHTYIDTYERLNKVEPKHQDINVHRLGYVSFFLFISKHKTLSSSSLSFDQL